MRAVPCAILAMAIAAAGATNAKPNGTGSIQPTVLIAGRPAPGACSFTATPTQDDTPQALNAAGLSALAVPAGLYQVAVTCADGRSVLKPPSTRVRVAAGKTSRPKFDIHTGHIRIMARRAGARTAAKVELYERGSSTRLMIGDANIKFRVPAATYDVLIKGPADDDHPVEAWLRNIRVRKNKIKNHKLELDDGKLIVRATNNKRRSEAGIQVLRPDGETVISGASGQKIALPPGRYSVKTTLIDAADFAASTEDIWITPGKTRNHSAHFVTGSISVKLKKDGRHQKATAHISKPGAADAFNFFPVPGKATLQPGEYNLSVEPNDAQGAISQIERSDVRVRAGKNTSVELDITPATVDVQVRMGSRRVQAKNIQIRLAGGGAQVPPSKKNGKFRLQPGWYEVIVELDDGTELVDQPFQAKFRDKITRTVKYTRGYVVVHAKRGDKPENDATVAIYKPGADVPIQTSAAGKKLELAPAIYDIQVSAGGDSEWIERVRVEADKQLDLDVKFIDRVKPKAAPKTPAPAAKSPPKAPAP